jgi:hypothetical protein
MVNVSELKKGDSIHYKPEHGEIQNGVVKSIAPNGGVFVVYNCGGEWHRFEEYTAANTRAEDLYLGWNANSH